MNSPRKQRSRSSQSPRLAPHSQFHVSSEHLHGAAASFPNAPECAIRSAEPNANHALLPTLPTISLPLGPRPATRVGWPAASFAFLRRRRVGDRRYPDGERYDNAPFIFFTPAAGRRSSPTSGGSQHTTAADCSCPRSTRTAWPVPRPRSSGGSGSGPSAGGTPRRDRCRSRTPLHTGW